MTAQDQLCSRPDAAEPAAAFRTHLTRNRTARNGPRQLCLGDSGEVQRLRPPAAVRQIEHAAAPGQRVIAAVLRAQHVGDIVADEADAHRLPQDLRLVAGQPVQPVLRIHRIDIAAGDTVDCLARVLLREVLAGVLPALVHVEQHIVERPVIAVQADEGFTNGRDADGRDPRSVFTALRRLPEHQQTLFQRLRRGKRIDARTRTGNVIFLVRIADDIRLHVEDRAFDTAASDIQSDRINHICLPGAETQMGFACASRYCSASADQSPLWRAVISASAANSGSVCPRAAKSSIAVSGRSICV